MSQIRIGIVGYGNLGRGVECAVRQNPDMQLVAVFTRRNPQDLSIQTAGVPVCTYEDLQAWQGKIDVMILCGGSATDLGEQTPHVAQWFHTIDSFDTHNKIPEFFASVDAVAKASQHVSVISVGWDPGMFSINRLYNNCILPEGKDYTFWGKGVSQGHSDAIRRVPGVLDGRQYTIPVDSAVEQVRRGGNPELSTREKHLRVCYVVAAENSDLGQIESTIKNMPDYFADYDTTVHFITAEQMQKEHAGQPHGGFVIRSGKTGAQSQNQHIVEYSLRLDSNPEFTSSVLVAYARAAMYLANKKESGAYTVFDIAPGWLSPQNASELRRQFL